jgi:hypothetical protein
MIRQKTVVLSLLAAILIVAVACSSEDPPPTPVPPTPTPEPTAPILVDPETQPLQFLAALPGTERECAVEAAGGIDRAVELLQGENDADPLTRAELEAVGACFSSETVQRVMIGQLDREAGGLSDATVSCIREQIGGLSAAALFTEDAGPESMRSLIGAIFCLNDEERAAVSDGNADYSFAELGGIDALECVVDTIGPTGLDDLMGMFSTDEASFETVDTLFPIMIECGAITDANFEDSGMTAVQIGCLIGELGEDSLALLDPSAGEPGMADVVAVFAALSACGIDSEGLMGGLTLPVDPGTFDDSAIDSGVLIESPDDVPGFSGTDLPFTAEQLACLTNEIGDDEIARLLSGEAPDLSLLRALSTCDIELMSLLAP